MLYYVILYIFGCIKCLKVVIGCTLLGPLASAHLQSGQAADWDADGDVDLVVPQGLGGTANIQIIHQLHR